MIDTTARFTPDLTQATADNSYYSLTMFPYPSGSGLHAGHASVFTINDVAARYQRMQGKIVLNPFGFDSFGLPTENYAIKQGKPAYQVTQENKEHFLKQVQALNISFDYERVLTTSDADYYKWTQWIFAKLYDAGLAYRDELRVNRCTDCQTVLANDQVVDGKCERCKHEIIQKKTPQWFIKITDYADRLIADLDTVDWPEETKIAQRNWIGRSEGAEIYFEVDPSDRYSGLDPESQEDQIKNGNSGDPDVHQNDDRLSPQTITCFTTRPDTIYGVTAVVLAPENTDLDDLLTDEKRQQVEEYRQQTLAKTAVQRQQDAKDKTGVESGLFVSHPLTGEQISVWYADYVLADYGSGAVMMVPAHDERDFEFAKKYGIGVKQVIGFDGITLAKFAKDGIIDTTGQTSYPQIKNYHIGDKPIYTLIESPYTNKEGFLVNSKNYNGLPCLVAKDQIIAELENQGKGKSKITYRLRDRSVSRQRYRGSPIPIYYDEDGNTHRIPYDELPVILPLDVANYKPKGKSPLEEHPTFPVYEKDGKKYCRECDTLDTFMCSAFYFLRFPNIGDDDELITKVLADKLFPIDLYMGGKEHTVGHLLYSRFIHKFLYDQGYVTSPEPFGKLVHQGMVLGTDGRKMGKRYGNGKDPLDLVREYGADATRMYLMFMGPVEQDKHRNENSLIGVKKFLTRLERLMPATGLELRASDEYMMKSPEDQSSARQSVESLYHQTIIDITTDLEKMKFNTVVSKIMILVNTIYEHGIAPHDVLIGLTKFVALFATELGDRMREALEQTDDVQFGRRPVADQSKIVQSSITLPVQINGKVRANIEVTPGSDEATVMDLAKQEANVQKYLDEKTIRKVIYIQDKILNIVVG